MVATLLASLHFRAFPEVPEALARLRQEGVRLVVVSNWDSSLPDVLARLGLARWLDGVVTCAEVGVRKPDRAVFDRALAVAGVAPGRALHVGDSPHEDIQGAVQAGIEPVLIRREGGSDRRVPDGVHTIIHSLGELPRLVCA
jgi:putative hydrolase of the HAD superfamily